MADGQCVKTDLRSSKQLTSWRIRASPRRALSRHERGANSNERVLRPAVFGKSARTQIPAYKYSTQAPVISYFTARSPSSALFGVALTRDTFRSDLVSGLPRAPLSIANAAAHQPRTSHVSLLPHWGVTNRAPVPAAGFCGLEAPRPKSGSYQRRWFLGPISYILVGTS